MNRQQQIRVVTMVLVFFTASPVGTSFSGSACNWCPRTAPTTRLRAAASLEPTSLDRHIQIDKDFPGLRKVHRTPDIYVIENFLTAEECDSIVDEAKTRDMVLSPVAYAGWTEDLKLVLRLLPVVVVPVMQNLLLRGTPKWEVAILTVGLWTALAAAVTALATAVASKREEDLQALRTSTSTTLPNAEGVGGRAIVAKAEGLLRSSWRNFEAPTVIRYEAGQALAPHYDANEGAVVEDAARGGQTLATLLVYLNDVAKGGRTRFGKLNVAVNPRKGDGLLFFPASAAGDFDDRVEHEGEQAVDEKWIARIWRHSARVPPPYGLPGVYGDKWE
jgi:hypothetical protein